MYKLNDFLAQAHMYQLGDLPTEQSHPLTQTLSESAKKNLPEAIECLRQVDLLALQELNKYVETMEELRQTLQKALSKGRRIYICGCGATGRLALSVEFFWRSLCPDRAHQIVSFMAGGDVALVHSLEGFEDFGEYGARQLVELGFAEGDILLACSEGGETPYVLGATLKAAELSPKNVFFFYCNPPSLLKEKLARCRSVFENPFIDSISLFVGPQAIAGSTRMQASTVLMFTVSTLLMTDQPVQKSLNDLQNCYESLDLLSLIPFIECEADIYHKHKHTLYVSNSAALTVMTDITERAPTFSLQAFNHMGSSDQKQKKTSSMAGAELSWSYLHIPHTKTSAQAWHQLLARSPRFLNWLDVHVKTSGDYLLGFDFSDTGKDWRHKQLYQKALHEFFIDQVDQGWLWRFKDHIWQWPKHNFLILDHLLLKMALNIHSTLVMGRIGRYEGNLMTYVVPTNGKLIDRAARYIQILAERRGSLKVSYDEALRVLFNQLSLDREEAKETPLVERACQAIFAEQQKSGLYCP